ncbi:MAG: extracellular solute-binding protein [Chloroflexi bacterium]|nr:extracellular solute-binding protein [Chloroflexota bacterium]
MSRTSCLLLLIPLVGILVGSCAQPSPPQATVTAPEAGARAPASGAGWEQKWDAVVADARKEGVVVIYSSWAPRIRSAITDGFRNRYGIDLLFSPFSRDADLLAKVQAEKRAGLYIADVFGVGTGPLINALKPEGLLGPVQPVLVLPEVLDGNSWRGGKIPFADEEGTALRMIGGVIRTVVYNTALVREGEITTYKDLLKPQFKGQIVMNDPSVSGAGSGAVSHLGYSLWGEAETLEFLRRLVKDQEAVVQRDARFQVESVVRGKYGVALFPSAPIVSDFLALGSPIKTAMVKEDNRLAVSSGALGVPTRFAHPAAATLFVNWLLTTEGQSLFVEAFGQPSTRLRASTAGVDPLFVPAPGEKYYEETEESLKDRARWITLARKVLDEAGR